MIVGIDIGGTKTHVCVEDDAGAALLDLSVKTADWQHGGHLHSEDNVRGLLALLDAVPDADAAPLVVGAHGLDSEGQTLAFSETLSQLHDGPALAVNDVELVGPAAGFDEAIAVIAGTGSKVVGRRIDGMLVSAGGYGYILNDPGSAPALVRDAVRTLFEAVDEDEPRDALADLLFAHFGVDEIVGLSNALTVRPRVTAWGAAAPLVFAAADAGSARAARVVENAADELAHSVELVHRRGAAGADVVCAGGVISHQPRLFEALGERLRARGLAHSIHLLDVPPVRGALALARRLTEAATAVPFAPTNTRRKS
ncbi:BadF/BadG/BcrA/BcrD ATPase family protein [Leifsonia sp. fls2-241-R2A-40a]|uniref:N-acetylglucosamine kinase n=1 Tax=Leifsonia sp. fls2-241-R2A-40a TaxID=3040290 RepID=UPI00254B724B|nr:BadF/BadG/BcrA/BcrD ATPase family protein [Leifsonia sp. fls2-241-R2A-40a]